MASKDLNRRALLKAFLGAALVSHGLKALPSEVPETHSAQREGVHYQFAGRDGIRRTIYLTVALSPWNIGDLIALTSAGHDVDGLYRINSINEFNQIEAIQVRPA